MNKFTPPTGDESAAPEIMPAEQVGAAQPVPGPNAAWSQGSGAPMSQPWAPAPAPVAQPGSQTARSSYGTFYTVMDKDGRSPGRWLIWSIGLACAALFTWIGIESGEWFYASASVTDGIVCLLLGAAKGGRLSWFVSVVSTPDGAILVRLGSAVMYLCVLAALFASATGMCFSYVSLFSVDADIRSIVDGNMLSAAVVALYLIAKIIGSQSRECIAASQQRVDMRGKGGTHYSTPWNNQPRVIGQHNSGRSLLIGVGQNIGCLVVFTTLRIHPSRVKSLLTYYQTAPGVLDHLSTLGTHDEAMKVLS